MGHIHKLGATLLAFAGIGLIASGSVAAFESRTPIEPAFGSFGNATGMAVDQSNGDTYVLDSSANEVFVFGPGGEVPPGVGPSSFTGVGTPGDAFSFAGEPAGLAVAKGEVVIPDSKNNRALKLVLNASHEYEYVCEITAYDAGDVACTSSGTTGGISLDEPLGAAIDTSGDIYVSDFGSGTIYEFNPAGTQIRQFGNAALGRPQYIAVAADGTIYAQKYGGHELLEFKRSSPTGEVEGEPLQIATGVTGVAYDQVTERVIVDLGSSVEELDAEGNIVESFGEGVIEDGGAVAINEAADHVYVLNSGEVVRFGVPVTLADATTSAASNATQKSVTVAGEVNPEGTKVVSCLFEYATSASYEEKASYDEVSPCTPGVSSGSPLTGAAPLPVGTNLTELEPGTTYHYRLVVSNENGSTYGADQTVSTETSLPTVNDTPPSVTSPTRSSVILTGTINPNGADVTYYFEYGSAEGYIWRTSPLTLGFAGVGDEMTKAVAIRELLPGATYHYALVAISEGRTVVGPDYTFTTSPSTPPAATTDGAIDIAQTVATIEGTVDTQDLQTTYAFQVAAAGEGYGPAMGLGGVGAGAVDAGVSVSLEGLQAGTTYRYRIVASNVDGTTYGEELSFTTAPFVSAFISPPAPLRLIASLQTGFPDESKTPVVAGKVKAKTKKKPQTKKKSQKKKVKHGKRKK